MRNCLILKGQFQKPLININILTFVPVNRVITIFIDVMSILFSDLNMLKYRLLSRTILNPPHLTHYSIPNEVK